MTEFNELLNETERARKNRSELKIGDRIKSYDFGPMKHSYIVGVVRKIAPVEFCGDECDHIHLEAEYGITEGHPRRDLNGKMYYPHLGNYIDIINE